MGPFPYTKLVETAGLISTSYSSAAAVLLTHVSGENKWSALKIVNAKHAAVEGTRGRRNAIQSTEHNIRTGTTFHGHITILFVREIVIQEDNISAVVIANSRVRTLSTASVKDGFRCYVPNMRPRSLEGPIPIHSPYPCQYQ